MNDLINEIFSFFSKKNATVIADKKQIRQEIRSLKKFLTVEQKQAASNAVFQKIEALSEFKTADTILIYWSTPDELPTQDTISKWCTQKQIFLPAIDGEKMVLKHYSPDGKMVQKSLGIWEPDLSESYDGKIDLVIAPGIAYDREKNLFFFIIPNHQLWLVLFLLFGNNKSIRKPDILLIASRVFLLYILLQPDSKYSGLFHLLFGVG